MAGKGLYTKVSIWLMVFCTTAFACNDGFFNCSGRPPGVEQTPALGYNMPNVNSYDNESWNRSRATRIDDPSDTHSFFISNCLNAETDCGGGMHVGVFGSTGGPAGYIMVLVKDNNTPPGFREIALGTQSPAACQNDPSTCSAPLNVSVGQNSVVWTGGSYSHGWDGGVGVPGLLWDMHSDTKLYRIQYPNTDRVDSATRTLEYDFNASCPQLKSGTAYRISSLHSDDQGLMKSFTVSKSSGATTTSRYTVVLYKDPTTHAYSCHVLASDTLLISRSGTSWPTGTVTSTPCKATIKEAIVSRWAEGNPDGVPAQVAIEIASPISGCPTGTKWLLWNVDSMSVIAVTNEGTGGATSHYGSIGGFHDFYTKSGANTLYGHPNATPNTPYTDFTGMTGTRNYGWQGNNSDNFAGSDFMGMETAEVAGTWTLPCQNEFCVIGVGAGSGGLGLGAIQATYGHNMITGASTYWDTAHGMGAMLYEGLAVFTSDNQNQWGLDNLGKHKSGIIAVSDH